MKNIPTKINKYNVYNEGNRLLGMGDEMSLPDFEASSETITGAGILGEIDDPTVGYFGNQEIEIPFRLLDKEAMSMMYMTKAIHLTIRGACQSTDSEGNIAFKPIRCVVRGRSKKLAAGKFKNGNPMDTSVSLTVLYILIEVDGETVIELDKLNEVFKVNGIDMLAEIKEMC